jgi:hypothetical protein
MPEAAVCGGPMRLITAATVADFCGVVVARREGPPGRKPGSGTRRPEGAASPGARIRRRVRLWPPAERLSHEGS